MKYRDFLLLGGNYQYPLWERAMEVASILVFSCILAPLGYEVYVGTGAMLAGSISGGEIGAWVLLVFVPLAAYLAADVASGVVHCAADNIGTENTPILGSAFIKPFRDHHRDPSDITHHDFVEANGNSCLVNLFVLVPTYLWAPVGSHGVALIWGTFILCFTVAIALTNQIHKWAHMPSPPAVVALVQRLGLMLTPAVHQVHHTIPFDRYYCITSGWMNPVLDRLKFFELFLRVAKGLPAAPAAPAVAEAVDDGLKAPKNRAS